MILPREDRGRLLQGLFQRSGEPDPQSDREAILRELFHGDSAQSPGRPMLTPPPQPDSTPMSPEALHAWRRPLRETNPKVADLSEFVQSLLGIRSGLLEPDASIADGLGMTIGAIPAGIIGGVNLVKQGAKSVAKATRTPTGRALNADAQLKTLTTPGAAMAPPAHAAEEASAELMRKILTRAAQTTDPVAKAEAQAGLKSLNKTDGSSRTPSPSPRVRPR